MTRAKLWPLVPICGALIFTSILLLFFGASPLVAGEAIINGAFGSAIKRYNVIAFWIPLLLSSLGLLITFRAGLWNIGIEGQIVAGALGATAVALFVQAPRPILIFLEIGAAMLCGALWAAIAAVLKTRGKVNEIFGGLALNNIAIVLTNFLVSGPWQPADQSSFTKTERFSDAALLTRFANSKLSLLSLLITIILIIVVYYVLSGTRWGLKLKALGKNPYSAYLLGVSSERETIMAMVFCGALAGLGGAVRVLSWYTELKQGISGGIGFLALLVVMLAAYRVLWVPLIALFFSIVLQGAIVLQLRTQLHSSLGGILTGVMVLFVLLFGDSSVLGKRSKETIKPDLEESNPAKEGV